MDTRESLTSAWDAHPLRALEGRHAPDETISPETLALAPPRPPLDASTLPVIALAPAEVSTGGEPGADLRVLSVLGEGGMGKVLLVQQRSLRREVAVKTLRPGVDDERAAAALLREGAVMGALEHPGIVPVHALGLDRNGAPVLVMKRIDGLSFEALLRDGEHPAWSRWLEVIDDRVDAAVMILMEVCTALDFAHTAGVIHRDVKPANILIGAGGEVYVADWGVALRVGEAGPPQVLGSPHFMAPEMVVGDPSRLSPRTDVYLLGATLHRVLTGRPPHDAATLQEALMAALTSRPPRYGPTVPDELAALCRDAMQPDPALRPESALAFRRRLAEHLRHRGSAALARQGHARAVALRALLDAPRPDTAALHRTAAECRYAFEQSLREWPDNPDARRGLADCLRALFDHELARENADAAEALCQELGAPPPCVEALASLRAALGARREQAARAAIEARERDVTVGAPQRVGALAALTTLAVVVSLPFVSAVSYDEGAIATFAGYMVGAPAAMLAGLAAVTWSLRGRLMATKVNRRLMGLFVAAISFTLVHRAGVLLAAPDTRVARVLSEELVLLGAMAGAAAVAFRAEFAAPAVCFTAAWLVSLRHPAWNRVTFTLATALGPLLVALPLRLRARRPDVADGASKPPPSL